MNSPATRIEGSPIQSDLQTIAYVAPRYLRERAGDFTDSRLASKLGTLATDTLLLLPGEISGVHVENIGNDHDYMINLTRIPELAAGRKNSQHEVDFGQLHIASDSTHPITELVAAKYIHRLTAPKEFHASRAVNQRFGSDVSFTPIGFTRESHSNDIGYLTRYEHGVVTLDNVLWDRLANPGLKEEAMGFAGLWLASLHNHDIIHGDAQAKNIAYDSSQQPRYPDLEGAESFDPLDPWSRIQRLKDVEDVFNKVYMPDTTKEENTAFIEAYLEHQSNSPERRPQLVDGDDLESTIEIARKEDSSYSA